MFKITTKFVVLMAGLGFSLIASAQLSTPNANPNSVNNDDVVVNVSFPSPVAGDLYFAVDVGGGNLLFFTPGLSSAVGAYSLNQNYSQEMTVLNLPASVVPAGTYVLYEVVAKAGSNVLDANNWIGGFSGLSQLTMNINLNNNVTINKDNASVGKELYKSLTCASSVCHGSNPLLNKNNVLKGTTLAEIKSAIRKNPTDMAFLSATSDEDLQAVADYIKSLR